MNRNTGTGVFGIATQLFLCGTALGTRVSAGRWEEAPGYAWAVLDLAGGVPLAYCHDVVCAARWFERFEGQSDGDFRADVHIFRASPYDAPSDEELARADFESSARALRWHGWLDQEELRKVISG